MRVSTPLYHRYSIRYCLTKLSKNIRYRRILSNVLRVFNKRFIVKAEYLAKIFELSWKYRTIVEYHAIIAFITSFFDRENFPSRERLSSIGPLGSFSSSLFFFSFFSFHNATNPRCSSIPSTKYPPSKIPWLPRRRKPRPRRKPTGVARVAISTAVAPRANRRKLDPLLARCH